MSLDSSQVADKLKKMKFKSTFLGFTFYLLLAVLVTPLDALLSIGQYESCDSCLRRCGGFNNQHIGLSNNIANNAFYSRENIGQYGSNIGTHLGGSYPTCGQVIGGNIGLGIEHQYRQGFNYGSNQGLNYLSNQGLGYSTNQGLSYGNTGAGLGYRQTLGVSTVRGNPFSGYGNPSSSSLNYKSQISKALTKSLQVGSSSISGGSKYLGSGYGGNSGIGFGGHSTGFSSTGIVSGNGLEYGNVYGGGSSVVPSTVGLGSLGQSLAYSSSENKAASDKSSNFVQNYEHHSPLSDVVNYQAHNAKESAMSHNKAEHFVYNGP